MRALLINPPRENEIVGNNPAIIDEVRGHNPPLGILYIAAYLEARTKHEVSVLDCQVEGLDSAGVARRAAALMPDVVGITAMTLCMVDVLDVVKAVKRSLPSATVVLGGPHVNLFPDETLNIEGVDLLVVGEGEQPFARLLDALEAGEGPGAVKGVVFKDSDGRVVNNGPPPLVVDLDSLPHPARHLVPYKKYTSILSPYNPITTAFTSRGCPFKCAFCDRPHLGKLFRARSAENVVEEMIRIKEMGIRYALIYDDTFTVNKERVIDICELLVKEKTGLFWDIRARVDTVNEKMLRLLKKAGCTGIHYGVESGSERVMDVLDKRISLNLVENVFMQTRRAGLKTLAYFMIGCPGETIEEIETTFRVARALRPDYLHMTVLTPFPGTAIYRMALEKGIIKTDVWREFAKNPSADFVPPVWGEKFSREELMMILSRGYREFYSRPSYIMRKAMEVRSLTQLGRFVRAGVKMLSPWGRTSSH